MRRRRHAPWHGTPILVLDGYPEQDYGLSASQQQGYEVPWSETPCPASLRTSRGTPAGGKAVADRELGAGSAAGTRRRLRCSNAEWGPFTGLRRTLPHGSRQRLSVALRRSCLTDHTVLWYQQRRLRGTVRGSTYCTVLPYSTTVSCLDSQAPCALVIL